MIINKIAFITNSIELYNHYSAIWKILPSDSFDIIAGGVEEKPDDIACFISKKGFACRTIENVLDSNQKYKYLVSHHPFVSHKLPSLRVISDIQIRFMYSLGKANWNFADWNSNYDVILSYGPYQREALEKICTATIIEMGYPRFDSFFDNTFCAKRTLETYRCDPTRKTIVWLPTWSNLASIELYQECISMLCLNFNVIVKLHPFMRYESPAATQKLKSLQFNAVIDDAIDNVSLYQAADYIFADYGGPMFGAIYTDKNLLLLNLQEAQTCRFLGDHSPEVMVRSLLPNLSTPDVNSMLSLLNDNVLWENQKEVRRALRQKFFAPYYGFSAQVAANCLTNIDTILDLQGKAK